MQPLVFLHDSLDSVLEGCQVKTEAAYTEIGSLSTNLGQMAMTVGEAVHRIQLTEAKVQSLSTLALLCANAGVGK